ncbi:MAG TPA: choice-of-anchor D domain-containing protein, partial [Acidimicrobiia bacterium]|nr:choice-of-anchor D domain-containing protein [Acidimicrobiia bacterium]
PESYLGTPLFGTQAHPHLMVEVGKAGYIYLVDRDDLGGYQAGPGMSDASLARIGSFAGVWSTPTVWPGGGGPGGGGYVYITHSASVNGPGGPGLRAYRYGVDASGLPTLAGAGQSSDPFGFGSGSPVVTSAGLDPGSALLWVVWQTNGSGNGAQLRAYDPVPVNGILNLRWSAPIGTAVKFAPPGVSDGRVYVGTRDGHVLAFGSPIDQPVVASPGSMSFPPTIVQQTTTQTLTLRATRPSTVTSLASNSAQFVVGQPSEELPADLDAGDTLSVPVTFAPSSRLITSGTLTATVDDAPDVSVALSGVGRLPVGDLYSFPGQLSLGGAPIGGAPLSASLTFSNVGAAPLRVTGTSVPPPSTYFSVTGLPAVGGTLAPGQSIIATVVFRPSAVGLFSGAVSLATDAAAPGTAVVTVPVSAGAAPPSRLVVSQSAVYFGPVRIGSAATRSVLLRNAGQSVVTITKSKPPAYASGLRPVTSLPEGTMLAPGETRTFTVTFQATRPGHFTDTWLINGNDGSGLHTIVFDAYASLPRATNWMVDGEGRVYTLGAGTSLGNAPVGSARAVTVVPTPSGLGYYVSDYRGRVFAFGDARALGTVPPGALQGGEVVSTMSVTPSGNGYWIFTSAGRVFRFGDAAGFGDLARVRLNQPIVASVATPSGQGYYMIGADGGVFSFGDAPFLGSVANLRLNQPVVGLVPTAGRGYWLVASDGGVFAFGDASFRGSMGSVRLNAPITGMVRYGNGYLMVAVDGGLFNFSSSPFVGSLSGRVLPAPIVGVAAFTV